MKDITYIKSITRIAYFIILMGIATSTFAGRYEKTASEYDKKIGLLYKAHQMDSMKIVLDEALRLYPNDTDLNRWAGTYFLQKKETDNARYFLIKAVEQDADNYQAKQQLVALEEELGNISSAICYVNEMLELYPYDQTLWKKKIGLYRKQGNDIEADRLLKRLHTIYPNDSTVQNSYLNRMEETYIQQRKEGNRNEAINTLKDLLKTPNKKKEYFLDLSNLLLQEGHSEEAVAILSQGLGYFPSDTDLIKKKAEIMAERGNNKEAIDLLRKSKSASLQPVANELMSETARTESWKDPYILYGRIYESQKSSEALDYLLRTSISRGYNEDALYYLSEYRKRNGNSPDILYKEYRIFRWIDDKKSAIRTLEKYIKLNSSDKEMADELAIMKTERADELIRNKMYDEAISDLKEAILLSKDTEIQHSITRKLIYCYLNANSNTEAISFIDSIRTTMSNTTLYVAQKAKALHKLNKSDLAIIEIEKYGNINSDIYEEISTEYMKKLLEAGAIKAAYKVSKNWIEKTPYSEQALIYAVKTSEELKLYNETEEYITRGRTAYPQEPFFVIKEASMMYRNGKYQSAMELLTPWIDSLPGNKELISVYSAQVEMKAEEYLKEKNENKALSIIQQALSLDKSNQGLLYLQGTAYEMKNEYDSAYISYVQFKPEALWMKEHKRKLMSVKRKGYRNLISTNVLTGWYSDGRHPNTIISAEYSRKMKKNYITATANISTRNTDINDTEVSPNASDLDNTGVQLRLDWEHTFNSKWSTRAGIAVANGIFPSWLGQAGAFYTFPKDIELGVALGYRKNYTPNSILLTDNAIRSGNMYNLRLSGGVYKDLWRVNTNLDGFMLNRTMYFNLNSQFRYYPLYDSNSHILVSAGVGTAPEIDFVDKLMPGSFENVNVSLGVGGVYMISKNLSLGLTATYHYFYNQTEDTVNEEKTDDIITNYKNLYELYAQLIFCF